MKLKSVFIPICFLLGFSAQADSSNLLRQTITAAIVDKDCNGNLWAQEILEAKFRSIAQQKCLDRYSAVTPFRETYVCANSFLSGTASYYCYIAF